MTEPAYEQTFVDHDGQHLGLQHYPDPDPTAPLVVIFPAMGTPARFYRRLAQALGAEGLGVVVADLRGTGASTPPPSRASTYGYAELAGDIGVVLDSLAPRTDGRTVLLLGHSLGGQIGLLHVATTETSTVDGVVLVAVGLPYFRSYRRGRRLGVLGFTQYIAGVSALLRVWPGWGFGGRQARGVIRDWGYTARTGRFPTLLGVDIEAALRRVQTPTLAVSVDHDQYTPSPTLDQLVAKLPAATVVREHYSTEQAGAPLDHFKWVRAAAPLAVRIAKFARVEVSGRTRRDGA